MHPVRPSTRPRPGPGRDQSAACWPLPGYTQPRHREEGFIASVHGPWGKDPWTRDRVHLSTDPVCALVMSHDVSTGVPAAPHPCEADPRPVVLVLVGLPASGKTTAARAWVVADPSRRLRFSNDDVRSMFGHPLPSDARWDAVPRAFMTIMRTMRNATIGAAVTRRSVGGRGQPQHRAASCPPSQRSRRRR